MSELKNISPQEWVKTLKGEGTKKYRKGRKQLRTKTGFCCLGVLADIRGCEWDMNHEESSASVDSVWMEEGCLYDAVMPKWLTHGDMNALAKNNDNEPGWDGVISYIEREIYPRVK